MIYLFGLSVIAFSSPVCTVEKFANKKQVISEAIITVDGRKIHILGWSHLSQEDERSLAKTVNSVLKRESVNCHNVRLRLAKALQDADVLQKRVNGPQATALGSSSGVIERLETIQKSTKIDVVGLEAASSTSNVTISRLIAMQVTNMESLKRSCPKIRNQIDEFAKVYLSPEIYFLTYRSRSGAIPEGVESRLLIKKSWASVDANYKMNAALTKLSGRLSTRSLELISQSLKRIELAKKSPTPEEIESVIQAEPNPEFHEPIRQVLTNFEKSGLWKGKYVTLRNKIILENIFSRKGNYALVIGEDHVSGLAEEAEKYCQRFKASSTTLKVNPEPNSDAALR